MGLSVHVRRNDVTGTTTRDEVVEQVLSACAQKSCSCAHHLLMILLIDLVLGAPWLMHRPDKMQLDVPIYSSAHTGVLRTLQLSDAADVNSCDQPGDSLVHHSGPSVRWPR